MKKLLIRIAFVYLLLGGTLHADELPYIYKGIRPLGMGNAFTALSDDANALFHNPAGLADISSTRISVLSLEIESNSMAREMYIDALDVDFGSVTETGSFLRDYIGDYGHSAVSVFPFYSQPNFALGIIGTVKANLLARDYQYPKLMVDAIEDAAVCVGYANPLLNGSLLVGAGVKYLFRRSLTEEYTVADITADDFEDRLEDDFQEGSGALIDLGFIYKIGSFQIADRPSTIQAGLSVSNLVGGNLGDAQDLDEHVDLGIAARIGENLILTMDYVDLFGQMGEDNSVGKLIHMGLEYRILDFIALRTGLNQGYTTLGFGIETKNIQIDLVTYAEEIATYAGQRDDRRYIFRMGFGF